MQKYGSVIINCKYGMSKSTLGLCVLTLSFIRCQHCQMIFLVNERVGGGLPVTLNENLVHFN